jgi:hypothetical protein
MSLGNFIFELKTAAFGSLHKSSEYRWSSTDVIGNPPVLQTLGCGADKIEMEGVIYHPAANPIDELKNLAEEGKPQMMVDGSGNIHGNWVIKQIDETGSYFDKFGNPKKVEFKVSLERYGSDYI